MTAQPKLEPQPHIEIYVEDDLSNLHAFARRPIIHIANITEENRAWALNYVLHHARALGELGMEPAFTINGEEVDLNAALNA